MPNVLEKTEQKYQTDTKNIDKNKIFFKDSAQELLSYADTVLYEAKENGRDRPPLLKLTEFELNKYLISIPAILTIAGIFYSETSS